jgi:membrane protein DedA with SNARE-associated domain
VVDGAPHPIDRKGVALFAVPMAVLTILGWIGDAFAPTLLTDAPLLLVVCNPRLRNLVLVSPTVDAVPFVLVAVGRLLISDPLFFYFGRRYGDVAIRWMERKLGAGATVVLWLERGFKRAAHLMVVLLPNNWICLLAGATKMRWWVFGLLNVAGTTARILLVRVLGDAFSDPILSFNSWIGAHRLQLTAITFGIVGIAIWRTARKGQAPLETPEDLAEELIEVADDPDLDAPPVDR